MRSSVRAGNPGDAFAIDPIGGAITAGESLSCDVEVSVVDHGLVVNTAFAASLDLPGELEATATFQGGGVVDIPTLSWPSLLLLAVLLAALSVWRLRLRRA
jgi:hypothetical protein